MVIRDMDDIERERQERAKREISKDASDVVENVLNNLEDTLKRRKIERAKKPIWQKLLKLIGFIIILVILLDLLFGSIWLLRFFIKSLFLK